MSVAPCATAASCQRMTESASLAQKAMCAPVVTRSRPGLAADRVQAEVVTVAAPEQDVGVILELAFGEHREAELRQRRFVHPPARRQVADSDTDVVDNPAHRGLNPLSVGSACMDEPYRAALLRSLPFVR